MQPHLYDFLYYSYYKLAQLQDRKYPLITPTFSGHMIPKCTFIYMTRFIDLTLPSCKIFKYTPLALTMSNRETLFYQVIGMTYSSIYLPLSILLYFFLYPVIFIFPHYYFYYHVLFNYPVYSSTLYKYTNKNLSLKPNPLAQEYPLSFDLLPS